MPHALHRISPVLQSLRHSGVYVVWQLPQAVPCLLGAAPGFFMYLLRTLVTAFLARRRSLRPDAGTPS